MPYNMLLVQTKQNMLLVVAWPWDKDTVCKTCYYLEEIMRFKSKRQTLHRQTYVGWNSADSCSMHKLEFSKQRCQNKWNNLMTQYWKNMLCLHHFQNIFQRPIQKTVSRWGQNKEIVTVICMFPNEYYFGKLW